MKGISIALLTMIILSSPVMANLNEASIALENNDIEKAQQLYNEATTQDKKSVDGKVVNARILMASKEYEQAYDLLEDIVEKHSQKADIQYYFGLSAMKMAQIASIFSKLGYAEDGLKALEKAITIEPKHEKALDVLIGFHLAAPSIAGGDKGAALKYANQLKNINETQGYIQVARVQQATEQTELSLQTLAEAINKYPEFGLFYFNRAVIHVSNSQWQQAFSDTNKAVIYAESEEEKAQAMYQLGKIAAESGEFLADGEKMLTPLLTSKAYGYPNWVKYRLAQVYLHKNDKTKAQSLVNDVDWGDDSTLEKQVKKLKKVLKG